MNLLGERLYHKDTEGAIFRFWRPEGKLSGYSTGRGRTSGEILLHAGHRRGNSLAVPGVKSLR